MKEEAIFILQLICAVLWTASAIITPCKSTKIMNTICAILWWLVVVLNILGL